MRTVMFGVIIATLPRLFWSRRLIVWGDIQLPGPAPVRKLDRVPSTST
jgi:hypothetical protein